MSVQEFFGPPGAGGEPVAVREVRQDPGVLTTGWEPETPVGDTVLRRFVFALAESGAATMPRAASNS